MTVLTVLAALTLSAAPIKIAAPDLEGVGITPELRSFYTSHLGQQLQMKGLLVVTSADIRALISQERQKELLGCGDSEACAVELGNALGADALLSGGIAKLGDSFQINVKVISGVDGKPLALYSGKAANEEAVIAELNRAAQALSDTLLAKEIPRRASAEVHRLQLFGDGERREGRFIYRNDDRRETGRRLIFGSLIGLPAGIILGVVLRGALPIVWAPIVGLSVVALPLGVLMYLAGNEERVPLNLALTVGDRNRFGVSYSFAF